MESVISSFIAGFQCYYHRLPYDIIVDIFRVWRVLLHHKRCVLIVKARLHQPQFGSLVEDLLNISHEAIVADLNEDGIVIAGGHGANALFNVHLVNGSLKKSLVVWNQR